MHKKDETKIFSVDWIYEGIRSELLVESIDLVKGREDAIHYIQSFKKGIRVFRILNIEEKIMSKAHV